MKFNLKKGFTLIELLIVIAIIGILASVLFSTFGATQTRAKESKALQGMKNAQTAAATCTLGTSASIIAAESGGSVCAGDTTTYPSLTDLTGWTYFTTGTGEGFSFGASNDAVGGYDTASKGIRCSMSGCERKGI